MATPLKKELFDDAAATSAPVTEAVTAAEASPKAGAILDVAEQERTLPLPLMLKTASERYGKTLQQIVYEIAKLGFGPGKISVEDYFALRLFDDASLAGADKKAFAGPRAFKPIEIDVNYNEHWLVTTGHKLVTEAVMRGFGYPIAETLAIHSTLCNYPAMKSLRTADDIRQYLADPSNYPLFCKPIDASLSLGTAAVDGLDEATGMLKLANGKEVPVADFISDILIHYGDGYLFQRRLKAHPEVIRLCGDRIPTIRFYTLNGPDGPELFRAVWKIPAGDSMADNYWRKNMLAAIDYESGRITRAITGNGIDQTEVETHPDTGTKLVGFEIPDWHATRDMVLEAARSLSELPLIGWDIAPTENGGIIVEANDRPDFLLVQMAERRGILEPRLLKIHAWAKDIRKQMKQSAAQRSKALKRKATQRIINAI